MSSERGSGGTKRKGFRQRSPFILIENYDCQKNDDTKSAWPEALKIANAVKLEKIHSFKIVMNFVREP
jgi:hypothetical protein